MGRLALCWGACAVIAANEVTAAQMPEPALAAAQVRALNHRFVDAFGTSQYRFAAEAVLSRQAIPRDVDVRVFPGVALVHGIAEVVSDSGAVERSRYTDVYEWTGSAWLRASSQSTPILPTAALATQRGLAARIAPWTGVDPLGADEDVLRVLNENYVRAFREADVAWYEAHLAADYVVTNPDGSMSDRAAALQDFAQPVFATRMKAFPVDHVRIRIVGSIALIHAENAYELKDGRRGMSRYTDIWFKQGGVWRCIAAHITPHVWPR
jgi:ketosteroid isomerase-like protein